MKTYFFCCKNPKLEDYTIFLCFFCQIFDIAREKSISSRCSLDLMRSFCLHLLFHFGGAKHCGNDFPQESVSHAASLDFSIQ